MTRSRLMMREAIGYRPAEKKIDCRSTASKDRFIGGPTAAALLGACSDQKGRTLFALARYGGLRCSSEVLELR